MKKALVCGAGGFIGSHLVNRLKREGLWERGVDLKHPEGASVVLKLCEQADVLLEGFRLTLFHDDHVHVIGVAATQDASGYVLGMTALLR